MNKIIFVLLFAFACNSVVLAAGRKLPPRFTIKVREGLRSPDSLSYQSASYFYPEDLRLTGIVVPGGKEFRFKQQKAVLINLGRIIPKLQVRPLFGWVLLELNDDITAEIDRDSVRFYGKGAEKLLLLEDYVSRLSTLAMPLNKRSSVVVDMRDFKEWNTHLDRQEQLVETVINKWRGKISPFALAYIKAQLISRFEYERILRFGIVRAKRETYNLSSDELVRIFDQTTSGLHSRWLINYSGATQANYVYFEYARQSTLRKYHFDLKHDSLTGTNELISYYNRSKHLFKGNALANCLTFLITSRGIKELTFKKGYVEEFEHLLARYYSDISDFLDHVRHVKEYDLKYHRFLSGIGQKGFNFSLTDLNGDRQSKEGYAGRLLLLNFWNPDNPKSTQTAKMLVHVARQVRDSCRLVVANISSEKDKNKWRALIRQNGLNDLTNLYTDGKGENDPAFKGYGVLGYPRTILLDESGKSVFNANNAYALDMHSGPLFPDPLKDNGEKLVAAIRLQLARLTDGPYVFAVGNKKTAFWVAPDAVRDSVADDFAVGTDRPGKKFTVALQRSINIPTSETAPGSKIFALSDIEGNFEKFRMLLQNNKIIDTGYNWTFGNGHLVFSGDMFDRGKQVTECLWLIYSLEEKAKASGGQVHFILGNHEIMNLQGDHRYADEKYQRSAEKLGKTLTELYGENTELGRWLRSKNIVEKIGDLLFVHGGLSPQISASSMTVSDMNQLARPYYADERPDYGDANTNLVMSQTYGPFWYRGYYGPKVNTGAAVDSILAKYKAKHIVTGHTIVADTISVLYDNKVINTDVPHAKDYSEALLVEGKNFYRVTYKGEKFLLFKED
ncbi:metallophosphoesterase [Pedobacter deserti]|uniref:metallophosphoesterase n=1 Tax=Pedobacter deserti TaxID=2817382 RepID=UPI00210C8FF5|nr:metallophosphoesterase [Pedobacter sp. SYSU D00382]